MSTRVLVTDGMDAGAMARLRQDGYEVVEQYYEPDELGTALRDFDAVIIRSATKIKAPQVDAAKGGRLKLIIRAGVGMDNIDIPYAEAAGIACKNTPRASSNAVAELSLGLMFSCARNISIAGQTMRQQKWEKKAYSKGFELSGKTLGIIGFGRIGQCLGRLAKALGMNVIAQDVYHIPGLEEELGIRYVELDELFAQADIVSLHTPSLNGVKLICKENIDKMKDGVVFINTSRGDNVNEADLLEALNSGKVKAAGLDVFADEKNPNWELISHPHVSATPHIGAGTNEAQARIGAELVDIVENFAF